METGIAPILCEAMLTPDELPGWSPVAGPADTESPFSETSYSRRFIAETSLRLEKGDTREGPGQHIRVVSRARVAALRSGKHTAGLQAQVKIRLRALVL